MYNFTKHNPIMSAAMATFLMVPLVLGMFLTLEPTVTIGQVTEDFTVRQQITDEIAFTVAPNNVTMDTAILGVSGGTSNGTSTFEITTNNSAGYTVTIAFASSTAMEFETGPEFIPNLTGGVVGTFDATAVPGTSGFGYTVTGPHVAGALLGTSGSCGTGSASANDCWYMDSNATTNYTIVSSSEASDSAGDPYNVYFRVVADGNPNPSLPEGFYTATATLTASNI